MPISVRSSSIRRLVSRAATTAAFTIAALFAGRAPADPLNPLAFPSLGALNRPAAFYFINTGVSIIDTPTLSDGVVTYHGTVTAQPTTFNPQVAVFDFDQITIAADAILVVTGNRPLSLLSRSDIVMNAGVQIEVQPGGA